MATMGPDVLPVRMLTVNVSVPSVVASAVGVTENEPKLLLITNEPLEVMRSVLAVVQYRVVPLGKKEVATSTVLELPSFTGALVIPAAYCGTMFRVSPTTKLVELPESSTSMKVPVLAVIALIVVRAPEVLPSIVRGTVGLTKNTPLICILVCPIMVLTVTGLSLLSNQKITVGSLLVSLIVALALKLPVLFPFESVEFRVIVKVSVPSVRPSLASTNVIVPMSFSMSIVPDKFVIVPACKSLVLMPVTVYPTLVEPMLAVVIVTTIFCPSL